MGANDLLSSKFVIVEEQPNNNGQSFNPSAGGGSGGGSSVGIDNVARAAAATAQNTANTGVVNAAAAQNTANTAETDAQTGITNAAAVQSELNAYLAAQPNSVKMFVAPSPVGNNAHDGLDERRPKSTWWAAYEALPSTGGTIEIQSGSYWGKPSNGNGINKQGVRLTSDTSHLPGGGSTLWPGFGLAKDCTTIGVRATHGNFTSGVAVIFPGDPGDGAFPQTGEYDYGIWLVGTDHTIEFYNIFSVTKGAVRLAVQGDPGISPFMSSQRDAQVTSFHFENVFGEDGGSGVQIPLFDIGYSYFGDFEKCGGTCRVDESVTSDLRSCFLVKGGNSTPNFQARHLRMANGGVRYYSANSTWGFSVEHAFMESDFVDPLPPVFWASNLTGSGVGYLLRMEQDDAPVGSMKPIKIEGAVNAGSQVQCIGNGPDEVDGSAFTFGGNVGDAATLTWPNRDGQPGFARSKIWGDHDGSRFNHAVAFQKYANIFPQAVAYPQNPTSNAVYTASGASGPHGVDSPVTDRWGGTTAFKLTSNDGSLATVDPVIKNLTVAPGDSVRIGFWAKIEGGKTFDPIQVSLQSFGAITDGQSINIDGNGDIILHTYPGEDGTWQWWSGALGIIDTTGHVGVSADLTVRVKAGQTSTVTICGLTTQQIPAADGRDEASNYVVMGGPTWQRPVGSVHTPPGKLMIVGNLATDGQLSASALTGLVACEPVYDATDGTTLIGYRPIYSTRTP